MVNVHAVAHPQTCDSCDEEFFGVDGLQWHVADVHENGKRVCKDQTEAQYKSDHSWFGKKEAQETKAEPTRLELNQFRMVGKPQQWHTLERF